MMHFQHRAQADTASTMGCDRYAGAGRGLRAEFQNFRPCVSGLKRIMRKDQGHTLTTQTRRRPVWNQTRDLTSIVRRVALVSR